MEDEAQELMEKEQWAMTSSPAGKDLLLVQRFLSLHHFLQSSIPYKVGVVSKLKTLAIYSMFLFADRLLHIQGVFIVAERNATVDVG